MVKVALPFGIKTPESKKHAYRNALRDAGIEPVENVTRLGDLAGLLLAGGSDIAPDRYGALPQPETGEPDGARDQLEVALVREALARDLPVLAICRGLQLLNVALEGTLVQHIDGHKCPDLRDAHPIAITPASRLASILETGDYWVNSRHHQAAEKLGSGVVGTATAPDGIIEALELPEKRFAVAVQWHPEMRTDGPDAKLFRAFREAMDAAYRSHPADPAVHGS
jgi:putative glutamine amidotransferase